MPKGKHRSIYWLFKISFFVNIILDLQRFLLITNNNDRCLCTSTAFSILSTPTSLKGTQQIKRNSGLSNWRRKFIVSSTSSDNSPFGTDTINTSKTSSDEQTKAQTANTTSATNSTTSRTLYDILGCHPTATKAQLKQRYVALAKQCHPDAIRGSSTQSTKTDATEFSEIANAWRILSNKRERRRYDRKLRAEEISREISATFSTLSDEVAPQVRDLLDSFAVPLIRR